MKKIILVIIALGFLTSAYAKDSAWLLCVGDATIGGENTKLVVNVYESRNGSGRKTELRMIYGGNTLKGDFNNTDTNSANVTLKESRSTYKGHVNVDYAASAIDLNGDLTLTGIKSTLKTTLPCESLSN